MAAKRGGNRKPGPVQGQSGAKVIFHNSDEDSQFDITAMQEAALDATLAPAVETHSADDTTFDPVVTETQQPITEKQTQEEEPPVLEPEPGSIEDPRFKGKPVDEVVKSYRELESKLGQQGQEIAEYRRFVDQFAQQSLHEKAQPQVPQQPSGEPSPQDVELLNKMLGNPRQFEQDLKKQIYDELNGMAQKQVVQKLWQEHQPTIMSPEFAAWEKQNVPTQMAQAAAHDPTVFNFILNSYRAHSGSDPNKARQAAQAEMATKTRTVAAATGAPAANRPSGEKVWSRREIMRLIQTNPSEYQKLAPQIQRAYSEGRVRD